MSVAIPVRTWRQTIEDARRFQEMRQIVVAYLHPDSEISREDALNSIIRLADTAEATVPPSLCRPANQ